jgi:hypothetical protein
MQAPHTGNAYLGIIAYNYGTEYREYATAELAVPLTAGVPYWVSFYASLNDGYIQAVQQLGAYLSATAPGPYSNTLHIPLTPQVENIGGILSDTAAWVQVYGVFNATGGEQYVTIGNFRDDASTTIATVGNTGSFGAYYFIDDLRVELLEGIAEWNNGSVLVYPTCFKNNFTVELNNAPVENLSYEITNSNGSKILSENIHNNSPHLKKQIDLSSFSSGMYVLAISTGRQVMHKKLIKL